MKRRFTLLLFLIFAWFATGWAQEVPPTDEYILKIISIDYDKQIQKVSVDISALKNKLNPSAINAANIEIRDLKGKKLKPLTIDEVNKKEPDSLEILTVLFLIDVSGSMHREGRGDLAKKAVSTSVRLSNFPPNSKIYLATFDDVVSSNIKVDRGNIAEILNSVVISRGDTDLYWAIVSKIDELKSLPGKKALLILSDGKNEIPNNPRYKSHGGTEDPLTEEDVYHTLSSLDSSFLVFPIALGSGTDTTFMKQLPDSTISDFDVYSYSKTPQQLEALFFSLVSGLSGNFTITLDPEYEYHGELRNMKMTWVSDIADEDPIVYAEDEKPYRLGSDLLPLTKPCSSGDFIRLLVIGLILLFIIFAILSLFVPLAKNRDFKRKYVRPYQQQGNLVEVDPVTNEPLENGQLVVMKCKQTIPLSVWQGLGGQCPNYPDCISYLGCDGAGAKQSHENFFSQKGNLKKLNWLLFGGFGGYLAWIVFALNKCEIMNFLWHENLVENFLTNIPGLIFQTSEISQIANQTLVGAGIGFGLATGISIVEQVGQSKRFSFLSVIIKILLGTLFGGLIFFGGAILQNTAIKDAIISGLIRWVVFGAIFGMVLSIMSAVSLKRGMLGCILASVIAYGVYIIPYLGIFDDSIIEYVQLASFIILGCILGYTIVTVVSRLEDFEFEFISPEAYSGRVVPISKWLKQGLEISIGTTPKSHIFIKWDDQVLEQHALLSYQDDRVFVEPVGETLVNGHMLSEKSLTPLKDRDIVQLGRYSVTQLRYKEKRSRSNDDPQPVVPDIAEFKQQQMEHKLTRPKIVFKPRNPD